MSRLNNLLIQNATNIFISEKEKEELRDLVFSTPDVQAKCLVCGGVAIGDIGLCRGHAIYCWATKK